ncbi:MAG: hypothetical protein LBK00_07425 [Treponema sp.]|jgi:hypothetical protein|nr:hypothetical protein [Treponema sp.]
MSHADVPENAATLEEQAACVHDYTRSKAAATVTLHGNQDKFARKVGF